MRFIQVFDTKDNSHFINIDTIVQIVDNPQGGTEITLSNGNLIVCEPNYCSRDIFKDIAEVKGAG